MIYSILIVIVLIFISIICAAFSGENHASTFFSNFKKIVCGDVILDSFNLNGNVVFYRAIFCTALVSSIFLLPLCEDKVSQKDVIGLHKGSEVHREQERVRTFEMMCAIGVIFSTIFSILRQDFSAKYLELYNRLDHVKEGWFTNLRNASENSEKKFRIEYEGVDFAEACLIYKLHTHPVFNEIYEEIVSCCVVLYFRDHECFRENLRFSKTLRSFVEKQSSDFEMVTQHQARFAAAENLDEIRDKRPIERRKIENTELRNLVDQLIAAHQKFESLEKIQNRDAFKIRKSIVSIVELDRIKNKVA